MQRKGLSGVVVSVLMVLLAIVAVFIVWNFVRPMVSNSWEYQPGSYVSVVKGSIVTNITEGNKTISFLVKMEEEKNITGFNVVLTDIDGKSASFRVNSSLNLMFSTARITIDYTSSGLSKIIQISVFPIYVNGGQEITGNMPAVVDMDIETAAQALPTFAVTGCQPISTSGINLLQNAVSSSGTCFTINANDVVIDCNGYSVRGNIVSEMGSQIVGFTIRNCTVNGNVIVNGQDGGETVDQYGRTIGGVRGGDGGTATINRSVINGSIYSTGGNGFVSYAYGEAGGSGGTIILRNTNVSREVDLDAGSGSRNSCGSGGTIELYESFVNLSISANGGDCVYGIGGNGGNVKYESRNVILPRSLSLSGNGDEDRYGFMGSLIVNYTSSFSDSQTNYIMGFGNGGPGFGGNYYTPNLKIIRDKVGVFDSGSIMNGNLSKGLTVSINSNSIYYNISNSINAFVPANLTLYGISTNLVDPAIYNYYFWWDRSLDGSICRDCTNYTSLNAGTVSFGAFGSGNYSIFSSTSAPTEYTIWSQNEIPTAYDNEVALVELGLKFRSDVSGSVVGVKFYKHLSNTGVHVGSLWDESGNLLARTTFTSESASGWQNASFSNPVDITANRVYVISYHTTQGNYGVDENYFSAPLNRDPLYAINSVYSYSSTPAFPSMGPYANSNYWVDVIMSSTPVIPTIPDVPALVATSHPGSIILDWNDVTGETNYLLERSSTSSTSGFTQIANIAADSVSYQDSAASPGVLYWYQLRANNSAGISGYSNLVSGAAGPLTPSVIKTPLIATPVLSNKVNLRWTDVIGETQYVVERSPYQSGGFQDIAYLAPGVTDYSDTQVSANTGYYYRIRIAGSGGDLGVSTTDYTQTPPAGGNVFYISPTPTGRDFTNCGTYTDPCATAKYIIYSRNMVGGDTIIYKDGTYPAQPISAPYDPDYLIPPSGTSSRYTRVIAEHDGAVVMDASNDAKTIFYTPLSYFMVRGIVFRNLTTKNINVIYGDHIKLIRIGAEGRGLDGNSAVVMVQESSYVLVEESYAWGSSRYKFIGYLSNNVIFRRNVARMDRVNAYNSATGGCEPIALFPLYQTFDSEVQNCISVDGDHPEFWYGVGEYDGSFTIPSTKGPSDNNRFVGSIALNTLLPFSLVTKDASYNQFENVVGWNISGISLVKAPSIFNHATFGNIFGPGDNGQVTGSPRQIGFDHSSGTWHPGTTSITNSIIQNVRKLKGTMSGIAFNTDSSIVSMNEDYNVLYNNENDRGGVVSVGSHSVNANPQLKYILNANGASSAVIGKASDGGNIGATVMKKIGVTGTLPDNAGYNITTNDDLWPFPYESVIARDFKSYSYTGPTTNSPHITYNTGNGPIKTLSGNRGFAALYPANPKPLTDYIWTYLGNPSPY